MGSGAGRGAPAGPSRGQQWARGRGSGRGWGKGNQSPRKLRTAHFLFVTTSVIGLNSGLFVEQFIITEHQFRFVT